MSTISMRHDPIKVSSSRFQTGRVLPFHQISEQISEVIESSRFPSWVGYTMITEAWPERFNTSAEVPGESAFQVSQRFCSA